MNFEMRENEAGLLFQSPKFLIFFGKRTTDLDKLKTVFPSLTFRSLKQVHSAKVLMPDAALEESVEADGFMSKQANVALCIYTADCLPVFMVSETDQMVVAVHAGWRGLEQEIIAKMGGLLVQSGIFPQNFHAVIGPHITARHFEVGLDVAEKLEHCFGKVRFDKKDSMTLPHPKSDKRYANLEQLARAQLKIMGTPLNNITTVNADTYENSEYHSFRRDGAAAGRQISFVVRLG